MRWPQSVLVIGTVCDPCNFYLSLQLLHYVLQLHRATCASLSCPHSFMTQCILQAFPLRQEHPSSIHFINRIFPTHHPEIISTDFTFGKSTRLALLTPAELDVPCNLYPDDTPCLSVPEYRSLLIEFFICLLHTLWKDIIFYLCILNGYVLSGII